MKPLALSVGGTTVGGVGGMPTGGGGQLVDYIDVGIELLIVFGIIFSLIFLMWGGLNWITSEGDKQKLARAKQKIIFSIIGLIIIFLSYFFINIVIGTILHL